MKRKNISKKKLFQLYIVENKSTTEIAKILNISSGTVSKKLKKFNIKKDPEVINASALKKRKDTCLDKYGVDNPSKTKKIKDKIKKTTLDKYGSECFLTSEEGIEKTKKTNLKKYKAEHHMQSSVYKKAKEDSGEIFASFQDEKIRKRAHDNLMKKYENKPGYGNPDIREKIYQTNLERYNFKIPMKNKEISQKSLNRKIFYGSLDLYYGKSFSEWARIFGITHSSIINIINKIDFKNEAEFINYFKNHSKETSLESYFSKNFEYKPYGKYFNLKKYPLLRYKPDFKINEKIAINVDGLYWHSELNKDNSYHYDMREEYEKRGLRLFQFREDEVFNKSEIIKSIINNSLFIIKNKIYARKCKIRKVSQVEASLFYNQYHMMGSINAKHIGLFYQDKLVSLISYKNYQSNLKIERFCSVTNSVVIGGLSKLLNYIYKINNPKEVYYWVDLRYGTGSGLLNLKFTKIKDTLGWRWTDGKNTFNRLQCRANMDERKLSQKEYAKELGWYKIYDAGQRLYVRKF